MTWSRAFQLRFLILALLLVPLDGYAELVGTCDQGAGGGRCTDPEAACRLGNGDEDNGECVTQRNNRGIRICVCAQTEGATQETETKAVGTGSIPAAPATMTFAMSARTAGSITVLSTPDCVVTVGVDSFSGTVTLASTATGDPNVDDIAITGGVLTAGSVILPGGTSTGANTVTFDGSGPSTGTLDRTTGDFSVSAPSKLTNLLYPLGSPIASAGQYFGTVNMATGVATVDSITFDTLPSEPSIVCPVPVPTFSDWGPVLSVLLLMGAAALVLYRRRTADHG